VRLQRQPDEELVTGRMCRHDGGSCRNTDAGLSPRMQPSGKYKKVKGISDDQGAHDLASEVHSSSTVRLENDTPRREIERNGVTAGLPL